MIVKTIVNADKDFMQDHAEELEEVEDAEELVAFFEDLRDSDRTYYRRNKIKMQRIFITLVYDLLGTEAFELDFDLDDDKDYGGASMKLTINYDVSSDLSDLMEMEELEFEAKDVCGPNGFWKAYKAGDFPGLNNIPENVVRDIVFNAPVEELF